jgi:hypothetical protein
MLPISSSRGWVTKFQFSLPAFGEASPLTSRMVNRTSFIANQMAGHREWLRVICSRLSPKIQFPYVGCDGSNSKGNKILFSFAECDKPRSKRCRLKMSSIWWGIRRSKSTDSRSTDLWNTAPKQLHFTNNFPYALSPEYHCRWSQHLFRLCRMSTENNPVITHLGGRWDESKP